MHDTSGFCLQLAHDDALSEADIAVLVSWFLGETQADVPDLGRVVNFILEHQIRTIINKSRLRTNLKKRRDISLGIADRIGIPLKARAAMLERFGTYLEEKPPTVLDTVLVLSEFEGDRAYIKGLVRQINSSYQFHIFDGCAVLMRRLVEVLIIESYERAEIGSAIHGGDNYLMLSGILNELTSGRNFKLSRNAPRILGRCKDIGDTAAHSRNYLTKKIDIDDFAQDFRRIVEEMKSLVPRP
ncbi:hypothetical protein ABIB57_002279 [Devosia sp. UYZn731]|uniref:hypothetical protein n=1 Tax=Devosia sp. UYZn731 TaxID=3156345 RepID=UPI003395E707